MSTVNEMTIEQYRALTAKPARPAVDGKARHKREQARAAEFLMYCRVYDVPEPEREYKFCAGRDWRADFAWPEHRIILESNGGGGAESGFTGGHRSGAACKAEYERNSVAALLGWRLFIVTPDLLMSPQTVAMLRQAMGLDPLDLERCFFFGVRKTFIPPTP